MLIKEFVNVVDVYKRQEPSNIELILTPPDSQDEGVWKYEHLRQVVNWYFRLLLPKIQSQLFIL